MPPISSYTQIRMMAEPANARDLVYRQWVEDLLSGKIKAPVRVAATTNQVGTYAAAPAMTFTYTATGALAIDGLTVAVGDRVLLAAQTAGAQDGIYTVTTAGNGGAAVLTRAADFNTSAMVQQGVHVSVLEGTTQAHATFRLVTNPPITLDTTVLEFVKVPLAAAASKYATTITGDGTATSFNVDHNLGSTDVHTQVFNLADHSLVLTDVVNSTVNRVVIGFATAPTNTETFRVVVQG